MNSHASGDEAECTAMNAVKLMTRPEQTVPSLLGLLSSLADALPPPGLCERTMERVEQDRLDRRAAQLARKAS